MNKPTCNIILRTHSTVCTIISFKLFMSGGGRNQNPLKLSLVVLLLVPVALIPYNRTCSKQPPACPQWPQVLALWETTSDRFQCTAYDSPYNGKWRTETPLFHTKMSLTQSPWEQCQRTMAAMAVQSDTQCTVVRISACLL